MSQRTARSRIELGATPEVASEHVEQKCLFEMMARHFGRWPELNFAFSVPNGVWYGGKPTPQRFALIAKMKREGMKNGVPDVVVPIVVHAGARVLPGLYLEMKRRKGSKLHDHDQIAYRNHLASQGYVVETCRGWEAAWAVIVAYLESGALANRVAA